MIAQIKTWYIRHRVYKQILRELNSLNYHQLRDLGFEPDMIPAIANQAAYGVRQ